MRRTPLRWLVPALLTLQLAMLWIQGAQIHRQNQLLQALREDMQDLVDRFIPDDEAQASGSGDAVPVARRVLRSAVALDTAPRVPGWATGALGGAAVLLLARLLVRRRP